MCISELFDLEEIYIPRWSNELTGKRPPKQYVEGFVSPKSFHLRPGLVDFVLHGFSYDEAVRMKKLLYIEHLRYSLLLKEKEGTYTPQELRDFALSISERIKEYNEDVNTLKG